MKIKILLILTLLIAVPVFNTGCAARTQQKIENVSYRTLSAIDLTVSTALRAYAEAYVDGKVCDEQHSSIKGMAAMYRVSMAAAIETARLDKNSLPPEELQNIAEALVNLIKEVL